MELWSNLICTALRNGNVVFFCRINFMAYSLCNNANFIFFLFEEIFIVLLCGTVTS